MIKRITVVVTLVLALGVGAFANTSFDVTVPEPGSLLLFGTAAMAGLGTLWRKLNR